MDGAATLLHGNCENEADAFRAKTAVLEAMSETFSSLARYRALEWVGVGGVDPEMSDDDVALVEGRATA